MAAIYPSLEERIVVGPGAVQGLGRGYAKHFAAQEGIHAIVALDGAQLFAKPLANDLFANGRRR